MPSAASIISTISDIYVLLLDSECVGILRRGAATQFSEENVEFLNAYTAYKNSTSHSATAVDAIRNKFIQIGVSKTVNIFATHRTAIMNFDADAASEAQREAIFDVAGEEIAALLRNSLGNMQLSDEDADVLRARLGGRQRS
eukprot:TRINITY_DN279_c0_g1_i4.p1 TRINITY_DN279_c0_g1~~TRINITY_DN279_c0_g1_i4.p1  ORF type:complete len:142 (-),score=31.32 TRINITY_DN279_c0_g1_i4:83-508(-)